MCMSICVHAFGWSCWPNECLRKTRLSKRTAGRIDVILFTPHPPTNTLARVMHIGVHRANSAVYMPIFIYTKPLCTRVNICVCVCVFVDFHPFDAMHTRPMRAGKCAGGCKLVWTSSLRRASQQADRRSDMAARRSRNSEYFTKPNRRPFWGEGGGCAARLLNGVRDCNMKRTVIMDALQQRTVCDEGSGWVERIDKPICIYNRCAPICNL